MNKLKKIILIPWNIILMTVRGFYYICSLMALGFYFYFVKLFEFIKKITKGKFSFIDKVIKHFEKRKSQPEFLLLLILYITTFWALYNIFYIKPVELVDNDKYISEEVDEVDSEDKVVDNSDNGNSGSGTTNYTESNLFRRYGSTSLDNVDFLELNKVNSDTVAWLSVDGTNINYPIVQSMDNDYYLNHSFDRSSKKSGWTFMDYRNDINILDKNTIIYGHNLLNKTGFGSLTNLFSTKWYNNSNKTIILLTKDKRYVFKVFSIYVTTPEVYYLQTEFLDDNDYKVFVDKLTSKSSISLGEDVGATDKIITLSTCTEDNTGRRVVHAKMIKEDYIG